MNDKVEKFKTLNQKLKELSEKKIRYEEQFNSRKQALAVLLREIKDAGYDPTKLDDAITEKESALDKTMESFEKELNSVSEKLAAIEGA